MTLFEKDFESMLRRYGDAVDDKKKFIGLIKDFFPQDARNINLMLLAYDIGIVQQIQNVGRINNAFAYRFVKQLTEPGERGLGRISLVYLLWEKYPWKRLRNQCAERCRPGNCSGAAVYKEIR